MLHSDGPVKTFGQPQLVTRFCGLLVRLLLFVELFKELSTLNYCTKRSCHPRLFLAMATLPLVTTDTGELPVHRKRWHVFIVKLHCGSPSLWRCQSQGFDHRHGAGSDDGLESATYVSRYHRRPVLFPSFQDRCAHGNVRYGA